MAVGRLWGRGEVGGGVGGNGGGGPSESNCSSLDVLFISVPALICDRRLPLESPADFLGSVLPCFGGRGPCFGGRGPCFRTDSGRGGGGAGGIELLVPGGGGGGGTNVLLPGRGGAGGIGDVFPSGGRGGGIVVALPDRGEEGNPSTLPLSISSKSSPMPLRTSSKANSSSSKKFLPVACFGGSLSDSLPAGAFG